MRQTRHNARQWGTPKWVLKPLPVCSPSVMYGHARHCTVVHCQDCAHKQSEQEASSFFGGEERRLAKARSFSTSLAVGVGGSG